jgi:hypothetical protein
MKHLDEIINGINQTLINGVGMTYHCEGIVKQIERGNERLNINKDLQPVIPDDKYEIYIYHKLRNERGEVFQKRGKKTVYTINSNLDLYVYSSYRNFDDWVKSRLCEVSDLTIVGLDHDSLRIFKSEIPSGNYDPKKYFFVVNYQVQYKSTHCNVQISDVC